MSQALELWPPADPERPEFLFRFGHALYLAGDERREHVVEAAVSALLAAGDRERAAEAYALLAEMWWHRGQRDRSLANQEQAMALVADAAASAGKARVLTEASRFRAIAGESQEALAVAREAYEMADALGLTELAARALNNIGLARTALGDPGGIEDLERSIELALSISSPEASRGYNNVGVQAFAAGDARRSKDLFEEAVRVGERFGSPALTRHSKGNLVMSLWRVGEWDRAAASADAFIAECDAGATHYMEAGVRRARARIRLARGESEQRVLEDVGRSLEIARAAKDPQTIYGALSGAARTFVELGRVMEAREVAGDFAGTPENLTPGVLGGLLDPAFVANELGYGEKVRDVLEPASASDRWRQACQALLDGDFERAAEILSEIGMVPYEADARFRAAEKLAAEGRRAEADVHLQKALAFWRSVGATRYIREAEGVLAKTA